MKNNSSDDRWIRARQEIEKRALPNVRTDSRITEVLEDFSKVDADLRYLISDSDSEFAEPVRSTLPPEQIDDIPSASPLSSAEKAELDGRILAAEVLGTDVLESTTHNPFDTRPMTNAELEGQIRATAEALKTGYSRGDRDAVEFVQRYGGPRPERTTHFITRLSVATDECGDFISPEVRAFVKGYVSDDRAAMRAAVGPLVREIVSG
jgi:hypothetical protein